MTPLQPTTKLLPNWALAGLLGAFVGGTYYYSLRAVGDDSGQEMEREFARQQKAAQK